MTETAQEVLAEINTLIDALPSSPDVPTRRLVYFADGLLDQYEELALAHRKLSEVNDQLCREVLTLRRLLAEVEAQRDSATFDGLAQRALVQSLRDQLVEERSRRGPA